MAKFKYKVTLVREFAGDTDHYLEEGEESISPQDCCKRMMQYENKDFAQFEGFLEGEFSCNVEIVE